MHRAVVILIVAALFVGCSQTGDETQRDTYLVLYAFEAEGNLVASKMEVEERDVQLGRDILVGDFGGKRIVLAESGVGTTNATMSVQKLLDTYEPTALIMTGIAGALDTAVRIGDVVVCDSWVQHDYVYAGNEETRHRGIWVYSPDLDSVVQMTSFTVDSSLLAAAQNLPGQELDLADIEGRTPTLHIGGVGASGNSFVDSRKMRSQLGSDFGAVIVDMESAAVAQTCFVNHVPVIVIRSASDLAGGSESASARDELSRFFAVAADNSAKILEHLLRAIQ